MGRLSRLFKGQRSSPSSESGSSSRVGATKTVVEPTFNDSIPGPTTEHSELFDI